MTPESLAIVTLPALGQIRPAAFVFVDAHGATWVEPSYRDPAGSTAPAVHYAMGSIRAQGDGFDVLDGGRVAATVRPLGSAQDDAEGSCARALADFSDLLLAAGVSLEAERAAVQHDLDAPPA